MLALLKLTVFGVLDKASNVGVTDAAAMLRVEFAPCVSVPGPASVVLTVNALAFVMVPLTVRLGIEIVPVMVLPVPLKVCAPVPAVKVPPLTVRFPPKETAGFCPPNELLKVPALMLKSPVNVAVPLLWLPS